MNTLSPGQFPGFHVALFCFNKIKTTVYDNSTHPCIECSLCGIIPVNIFKYFIKTCVQYFQSIGFSFCIAETKVHHGPVVAPVQLLLGLAVAGFAAADDAIYVLFFANQIIFLSFPEMFLQFLEYTSLSLVAVLYVNKILP